MSKFQCFIDTGDITECFLIVLPSPDAIESVGSEYYDDYYIQLMVSSVEGNLYFFLTATKKLFSRNSPKKDPTAPTSATEPAPEPKKDAIGTVHFKVLFSPPIFCFRCGHHQVNSSDLKEWTKCQISCGNELH